MTLQEIRELVQLVVESGVAELEVKRGADEVHIKSGFAGAHGATVTGVPAGTAAAPPPVPVPHKAGPAAPEAPIPADVLCDPSLKMITSPIVGTFYEASAPGVASFVKVGDRIEPGKVVCIIESMKLMNEIEAEISGTIVSRLIENGKPVEYGEALFAVRPA